MKFNKQNKKIILGVGALICCIGIIVLCSFFPFVIDPNRWQTTEFLSDELIVSAIVIFSIVCVMYIGQAYNAQNPDSNIAKAKVAFYNTSSRITDINAFEQWIERVLQPNDIRQEKETLLRRCGIDDFTIIDLEKSEIKALIDTPQKYNGRYYKGISKKQYKEVLNAKYFKMKLVNSSYYLTCSAIAPNQTISKKSGNEVRKKGTLLTWSISFKVIISVITAMIFASLVYDMTEGDNQAQAWLKFLSRMMAMASSSYMGFMIGCQTNDIDADFINNKVLAHTKYLQDKDFKPKSQQELAKEQFIDRIKEENIKKITEVNDNG